MSGQGTEVRTFARQRVLFCLCGQCTLYAAGKCLRCYSRDKRNERHYASLREVVLKRDGHRCRTCPFTPTAEGERRLLVVHHRQPGVSELPRMLTLCAACHARVERTKFLTRDVSNLVRELWRELHPQGPEQPWLPLALSGESTRRER
jgi:5-methylcytosine-specific restriction endonuclease McrA